MTGRRLTIALAITALIMFTSAVHAQVSPNQQFWRSTAPQNLQTAPRNQPSTEPFSTTPVRYYQENAQPGQPVPLPDPTTQQDAQNNQSQTNGQRNGQNGQNGLNGQDDELKQHADDGPGLTSNVLDPVVNLQRTRLTRQQAKTPGDALFRRSPLTPFRERAIAFEKRIYEARDLKFGTNINTLMQGLTDNIDGTDDYGSSSFLQFNASWDGFR